MKTKEIYGIFAEYSIPEYSEKHPINKKDCNY